MCQHRNLSSTTEVQDETHLAKDIDEVPSRSLNWSPGHCGVVQMCHIMPTQCGQCPMCQHRNLSSTTEVQDETHLAKDTDEVPSRSLNWCPGYCGVVQMCHIMPTQCGQCPMCQHRNLSSTT